MKGRHRFGSRHGRKSSHYRGRRHKVIKYQELPRGGFRL